MWLFDFNDSCVKNHSIRENRPLSCDNNPMEYMGIMINCFTGFKHQRPALGLAKPWMAGSGTEMVPKAPENHNPTRDTIAPCSMSNRPRVNCF